MKGKPGNRSVVGPNSRRNVRSNHKRFHTAPRPDFLQFGHDLEGGVAQRAARSNPHEPVQPHVRCLGEPAQIPGIGEPHSGALGRGAPSRMQPSRRNRVRAHPAPCQPRQREQDIAAVVARTHEPKYLGTRNPVARSPHAPNHFGGQRRRGPIHEWFAALQ